MSEVTSPAISRKFKEIKTRSGQLLAALGYDPDLTDVDPGLFCMRLFLHSSPHIHLTRHVYAVKSSFINNNTDEAVNYAEPITKTLQLIFMICLANTNVTANKRKAIRDFDPVRSLVALRRGLVIAQDSGNRANLTHLALNLRFEANHGDPLAAFHNFTLAIGNYHDTGNTYMIRGPLGRLAALFDRLGRSEPAATIAGFAVTSPLAALPVMAEFGTAIAHLRDVFGEATYESLAHQGGTMTTAEIVSYAFAQIDQARTELGRPD